MRDLAVISSKLSVYKEAFSFLIPVVVVVVVVAVVVEIAAPATGSSGGGRGDSGGSVVVGGVGRRRRGNCCYYLGMALIKYIFAQKCPSCDHSIFFPSRICSEPMFIILSKCYTSSNLRDEWMLIRYVVVVNGGDVVGGDGDDVVNETKVAEINSTSDQIKKKLLIKDIQIIVVMSFPYQGPHNLYLMETG